MARELAEHNGAEGDLEADYQAASDHLNLVQTALRQQEKIERYEADLDELQIRLEEQNEVVAEAIERQEENEARAEAAELEVDELKSQLADYQQRWTSSKRARSSITRRLLRLIVPKNCAICRT